MKLTLNGKPIEVEKHMSVTQLLIQNRINLEHTVVELSGEIILSDQWDSTIIQDGDVVEVLSFVGGG